MFQRGMIMIVFYTTHMFELPDAVGDAADGAEPAQAQHPHLGPVGGEV